MLTSLLLPQLHFSRSFTISRNVYIIATCNDKHRWCCGGSWRDLFEERDGKDRNRCAYFYDLRCCVSNAVSLITCDLTHLVYEKLEIRTYASFDGPSLILGFLAYPADYTWCLIIVVCCTLKKMYLYSFFNSSCCRFAYHSYAKRQ